MAIQLNALLTIQTRSVRQGRRLGVMPQMHHLFHGDRMVYRSNLLDDNRAFIEIRCDKMRGCTNYFDATVVGLMVIDADANPVLLDRSLVGMYHGLT